MTPGAAFTSYIKGDAAIMALVSGISPVDVPQGADLATKAWVTYRWLSGNVQAVHDGAGNLNLGGRLEVTVWSPSMESATKVNYLIRSKLGGFRGTMGGVGGVTMACSKVEGPRQFKNPATGYMASQSDFIVGVDEGTVS